MYIIVWRYRIRRGAEPEFERIYGPDGEWAAFFREDGAYRGTELLRSTATPGGYMTIDRWVSRSDYEQFHARRRVEYEGIDRRCERLTESEVRLGAYDTVGAEASVGRRRTRRAPGATGHGRKEGDA